MSNWRITIVLAISAAGAFAADNACALHVGPASDGIEQNESGRAMPLDRAFVRDAPSGTIVLSSGSPLKGTIPEWQFGADAYTVRPPRYVAVRNSNGADEYFPRKYRDGRCVEDEGNSLLAERAPGVVYADWKANLWKRHWHCCVGKPRPRPVS